jgi:hypothetical protein
MGPEGLLKELRSNPLEALQLHPVFRARAVCGRARQGPASAAVMYVDLV